MSPQRKTLAQYGKRTDRVRVLVDRNRDRIEVLYRDPAGVRRKRVFANTSEGRAEAETWAETYHARRAEIVAAGSVHAARPRLTIRELWARYTESPAYTEEIREKTRINYRDRWRHWELFLKPEAIAEETTLDDVDRFRVFAASTGLVQNSIRNTLNVVRVVYNWGTTRKLLAHNEIAVFRWKQPKDVPVFEPEEYTEAEFLALLHATFPVHARTWRVWVALMLVGHHGQRARAVLHLRWEDVDWAAGVIRWPAAYQKQGVALVQPITVEARAALTTAELWRARTGYTGPWVLFAGGGNKRLGEALVGNARHYRRARTAGQDTAYTYQALWRALKKAEGRAGVTPKPYRSLHGFRKMVAGNVADRTNDPRLGMEWIGDRDLKQAKRYLKRRSERLDRAADAAGLTSSEAAPRPRPAQPAEVPSDA